jgi:Flp pilus assembly protein TadG
MLRLLGRDDRGAIGVIVAVLIGGGVLLGMGALVIDVGQIYQNRAELQNGADSAALAAARQCALGTCAPASATSTALTYANANASALTQHTAGVSAVCGSDGLGDCSSLIGTGLTNCPPDPTNGVHFVDVLASTKLPSGSTLLPPVFGQTLVGNGTYDGTMVKACAQAEWGSGGGLALTISSCEWAVGAGGTGSPPVAGTRYWNPKNGTPPASYDTQFLIHSGGKTPDTTCQDGPAGHDAPGAFGWTTDPNGNCQTLITNNTYGAKPGNSATADCQAALQADVQSHAQVLIPVYSSVTGQGNNTIYTLDGFASAIITGFNVPGDTVNDWLNPGFLCGPPDTCIDGYLTTNTLSPTATSAAVTTVKLTG